MMTAEELLNELQKGKRVKAVNAPAEYGQHWNGGEYEYITVYSYSGGEYRKVEWCSADFGGYCSAWGGFNADCDRCGWGEEGKLIQVPVQFDESKSFIEQAFELVESVGLSPKEWQEEPIVIIPPSLSSIACVVLAILQGTMGYLPPIVRMSRVPDSMPPRFEAAEIIGLQSVSNEAHWQAHYYIRWHNVWDKPAL